MLNLLRSKKVTLFSAIFLGKVISFLVKLFNIGGGSAAPGLYALKLYPNLIEKLSKNIPQNIIITGTNGKTTTARFLSHFLKSQNLKVIRNLTGSNLERGIASILINSTSIFGSLKKDIGVWELDEAAFNTVVFQIKPEIIVFLNVFRDQLDRYGEIDTVLRKWQETLKKIDWNPVIILNGNDLNVLSLKNSQQKFSVFKIKGEKDYGERSLTKTEEVEGEFEAKILDASGMDRTKITLNFPKGKYRFDIPLPGVYHIYDFLAAFVSFYHLNSDTSQIKDKLSDFKPPFGRYEKISLGEQNGFIFLIKNPAGASMVFQTIAKQIKPGDSMLLALNDNFADGTDVSWIWDGEFERLQTSDYRLQIICSGSRAYDLAVRLKYAGNPQENIQIEPNLEKAFNLAKKGLIGNLYILPTYTALLELQKILVKRGVKPEHYWKEEN